MKDGDVLQAGDLLSELFVLAVVSASHMSLPNHWLPFLLVGQAQGWALRSIVLMST